MTDTTRATLVKALRDAASFYEKNPDVPVPDEVELSACIGWPENGKRDALIAEVARAMSPCVKDYTDTLLYLRRGFGPITVEAYASRSAVCERKVVGTRTVEREVVVTPAVTRTETVEEEVVEWECSPVLASAEVA